MNKEFLRKLLETPSPSGYEKAGLKLWKDEMQGFTWGYSDKSGNLGFSVGTGPELILLSGHIDEICLAVRYIDDTGFLVPCQMAGVDKKVLPGHSVIVLGETGELIHGVVQKNPIHIEHGEEEKKVINLEDLRIDLGVRSKKEVEDLGIYIGSLIVLGREINLEFGKTMLHGNSLDDKAGVYVVSEVLKELGKDLGDWRDKYTILGLACIGEESGLLGARRVMNNIKPHISIDLDVTHACDTGQFKREKYGDIRLGSGPVLEYGQDKSRRLNKILQDQAEKLGLEYQRSASRIGGTNTREFYLGGDTETTLISLPLLSMHTPVETMDWRDIEGTAKLLVETIKSKSL